MGAAEAAEPCVTNLLTLNSLVNPLLDRLLELSLT